MRNETVRIHGWVRSMVVAGGLFYIGGHEHHLQFSVTTDSESEYHCQILNRTDSEGAYM